MSKLESRESWEDGHKTLADHVQEHGAGLSNYGGLELRPEELGPAPMQQGELQDQRWPLHLGYPENIPTR